VSFDLLRLVAGGAKVIHDFQDGLSEQLAGHIPSVIELKWEQDLESPPFAAHIWSSQSRRMGCSGQRVPPVPLQEQDVHLIEVPGQRIDPIEKPAHVSQSRDWEM